MNKRIPILLGIILTCFAAWLLITSNKVVEQIIDRLDNLGYDLQLSTLVLTEKIKPNTPIAIVDIDDKSLKAAGRWPWPRSKLAELINKMHEQGAAVIAFDIFFPEKEKNIVQTVLEYLNKQPDANASFISTLKQSESTFDEDTILAKSIAQTQSILAFTFMPHAQTQNFLSPPLLTLTKDQQTELQIINAPGYITNIPILQQAARGSGFINIFPDNDGIIRRAPLVMKYKDGVYPSLSLQTVLSFLGEDIKLLTPSYGKEKKLEGIKIGSRIIPTDAQGQVLIPFIGKSYTFAYYSAIDVLEGKVPSNALLGKIIFVGTSATGLGDLQATSIQSPFPGVEVQATLVNGMLQNNFSYKPEWTFGANLFLTILFGLAAAFIFPYLGPRALGTLIFILPAALLFINNLMWQQTGLVLSFLLPVILLLILAILNIMYGYLFETRKREHLKEMFGQYVPARHIDEMLKSSGSYGLSGEDREMTVLFADIRNFTSISEKMSAAELKDFLNIFFTPMTEIIFKHHGTIDKYVGDLIMAFWGAPLKDKNHARHALESALEMQAKVKELMPLFAKRSLAEVNIGIGVNSGIMSVGDMGSRYRLNYTVLGDTVNLASRIEGLTKFYGTDIITTETTQQNQSRFVFRQLDRVRVKGKHASTAIYELLCTQAELTPELQKELATFNTALNFYFQQAWDKAYVLMQQLQQTYPDKKLYNLYLERIKEFKSHPLPADWDGVYVHVVRE